MNEVIPKHYLNLKDQLDLTVPLNSLNDEPKKMQPRNVFICEIDSRVWYKALFTASSDVTTRTYPHVSVVKNLLNYTLNVYGHTDISSVTDFFTKLLLFHPPVTTEMRDYYYDVLNDNYVKLNDKAVEEDSLFWCLINNLLIYTEDKNCLVDIDNVELTSLKVSDLEQLTNELKQMGAKYHKKAKEKKMMMYYDELPQEEKIKRCLICLNCLSSIFETDFMRWFDSKKLKLVPFDKTNQPLLANLIWNDIRDIGIFNSNVKKILTIQQNLQECNSTYVYVVDKLLALVAEIMHYSDALIDSTYPFLGPNSNTLARELSYFVLERLKTKREKNDLNICELILDIKPAWMRLLVISYLLSVITGTPCSPELTNAVDILIHIEHETSNKDSVPGSIKNRKPIIADPKIVERLGKLKSVNSKLITGGTRLHTACRRNNVDEVKALLTFPELEINATDNDDWTALHEAALKGNKDCVDELLSFWPQLGEIQKPVDTRAQGKDGLTPLMCAVLGNHPEVCQLLLEHTGSVLLEDVNDHNKTPLDLASSEGVTRVLQHYKDNFKTTEHSKKKMHFSSDNTGVVFELCYHLVLAYFSTYRTWDVYHCLKAKTQSSEKSSYRIQGDQIQHTYLRYHRDIKTNIDKLRKITGKLSKLPEFKNLIDPLINLLMLNRYHK